MKTFVTFFFSFREMEREVKNLIVDRLDDVRALWLCLLIDVYRDAKKRKVREIK